MIRNGPKKKYSRRHLLSMPEKVMAKILEKSDFISILTLRKVCRDFRNLIDDVKPEFHLDIIEIHINPDYVKIFVNDQAFNRHSARIQYRKFENGCKIVSGKKEKIMEIDYLDYFCNDFENMLSYQKQKTFSFSLHANVIPDQFQNILKSNNLKTSCVSITTIGQDQIMQVLPFFQEVDEICLVNGGSSSRILLNMNKIVKLDQWKKANSLEIVMFFVDVPLNNFSQFLNANLSVKTVLPQELWDLKEAFLKLPGFKYFNIQYSSKMNVSEVNDLFGSPYFDDPCLQLDFGRWFFKVPDTNTVIQFVLHFAKHVQFSGINLESVPKNATIVS